AVMIRAQAPCANADVSGIVTTSCPASLINAFVNPTQCGTGEYAPVDLQSYLSIVPGPKGGKPGKPSKAVTKIIQKLQPRLAELRGCIKYSAPVCSITAPECDTNPEILGAMYMSSLPKYVANILDRTTIPPSKPKRGKPSVGSVKTLIEKGKIALTMDFPALIDAYATRDAGQCELPTMYGIPAGCNPIQVRGQPQDKLDIVFVNDNHPDETTFLALVNATLYGDAAVPITERRGEQYGLFDIEPWKSNRDKINVWAVFTPPRELPTLKIGDTTMTIQPSDRRRASYPQLLLDERRCVEPDVTVMLSVHDFRSSCEAVWQPPTVTASWPPGSDGTPGMLVTHELGHCVGKLRDEYRELGYTERGGFEVIDPKVSYGKYTGTIDPVLADLLRPGMPNCGLGLEDARQKWGDVVGGQIGMFQGCGGTTAKGKLAPQLIRPMYNSIMSMHRFSCDVEGNDNELSK
ncbi:MAG: hypothetical protein AABY13_05895, partial [Nanoarchaeota archaeon]